MSYEAVIGLEVHVQLQTTTKLFCGNSTEFGAEPNTHVCPVCLGLPGALPVTNREAVALAIRAGLGLNCQIHEVSLFARKNYFYPDLPKGYQITQFDRPLATAGWLAVPAAVHAAAAAASQLAGSAAGLASAGATDGDVQRVRIRRIHLEEDAGKSLHDRISGCTAVDLNRAGVPLIEIVTEPDLATPGQARTFLTRLKQVLQYLEVSDCDMEKGSLRVDANVSVRPVGEDTLGTKTEVKNMNSFANVERAIAFEVQRQIALLESGGVVVHETLLWDEARGEARPMRSKEESHDYRYFPDPDLPPLVVGTELVETARAALPELPHARLERLQLAYGLPAYDAEVLTASRELADYFEAVARQAGDGKAASNWVMTEVLGWLNQQQRGLDQLPVPPEHLARLIELVANGTLSSTMARRVFAEMARTGRAPDGIVEEQGLVQVRDVSRIEEWAEEIVASYPAEAERYRAGEHKLLGFFMGELMKRSRGQADPRSATAVLREKLSAAGTGA